MNGAKALGAINYFEFACIGRFPEEEKRNREAHHQGLDKAVLARGLPGVFALVGRNLEVPSVHLQGEKFDGVLCEVEFDALGLLDDLGFGSVDLILIWGHGQSSPCGE